MISKREGRLDRIVLRELRDPKYRAIQREAWRRCVLLGARRVEETARETYDYWTPAWERKRVAEAEAERDRRREIAHEMAVRAIGEGSLRKPPARETEHVKPGRIRRVK
jgi:hypothetical protein